MVALSTQRAILLPHLAVAVSHPGRVQNPHPPPFVPIEVLFDPYRPAPCSPAQEYIIDEFVVGTIARHRQRRRCVCIALILDKHTSY
jgi:hypothetical protein